MLLRQQRQEGVEVGIKTAGVTFWALAPWQRSSAPQRWSAKWLGIFVSHWISYAVLAIHYSIHSSDPNAQTLRRVTRNTAIMGQSHTAGTPQAHSECALEVCGHGQKKCKIADMVREQHLRNRNSRSCRSATSWTTSVCARWATPVARLSMAEIS